MDIRTEVTILVTHTPAHDWNWSLDGWRASAPGIEGGSRHTVWEAIARALYLWDSIGRPGPGRIVYAPVGPGVVGSVAEEARAIYARRAP
jgi:hypothetical protein